MKGDQMGIRAASPTRRNCRSQTGRGLDSVGLGLGNSGEEQHGDAACRKEGSDCDGFEETHGWLLTLKLGLCGSVVGRGKGRLLSLCESNIKFVTNCTNCLRAVARQS